MGPKTCSAGFCLTVLGLSALTISPVGLVLVCSGIGMIAGSGIALIVDCITDRE